MLFFNSSSSLGHVFGCKQMTESGIVLNDGMALFPDDWKVLSLPLINVVSCIYVSLVKGCPEKSTSFN